MCQYPIPSQCQRHIDLRQSRLRTSRTPRDDLLLVSPTVLSRDPMRGLSALPRTGARRCAQDEGRSANGKPDAYELRRCANGDALILILIWNHTVPSRFGNRAFHDIPLTTCCSPSDTCQLIPG